MGWRAVFIGNPSRLRIDSERLIIEQEEEVTFPLEDLCALVLESPAVILSSALLARLAAHDILLLICDEKHLPCAVMLPSAGHSRLPKMQRMQLSLGLPFRKRCWQAIVRQKIANQAECLRLLERPGADLLLSMLPAVASGDSGNVESRAARHYFPAVFGDGFTRGDDEHLINAALNYGYAIMRGVVARAFAAHGLILSQGIHHHSELNPFNLADDFLEPLRPAVDLFVETMMPGEENFDRYHRMALAALLGCDMLIDEKRQPILRAVEGMASSFVRAGEQNDYRCLHLPVLLPIQPHRYE